MKHILIKEEAPTVSVIVPVYNGEKYLASTLNSLVSQRYQDFELIIVNDGSTDSTEKIIKHFFFDRRVKLVTKENGGTGSALNMGHMMARGKYATWCSADNIYLPNFLLELVIALEQCQQERLPIEFVYSDFAYMDANGNKIKDLFHEKPQTREDLANGYDLGVSFMYTMNLWRKTGLYWPNICEDYEWAVRAAQHTHFGLIKSVLVAYRVHPGQISGNKKEEEDAAAEHCRNLAKQFIAVGKYGPVEAKFNPVLVEDA